MDAPETTPITDTQIIRRVTAKHETTVLWIKGLCFLGIGTLTPLTTALTQYQASEKWPHPIVWIVVLALCAIGGFSAILSFLSGSYSDYKSKYEKTPPR